MSQISDPARAGHPGMDKKSGMFVLDDGKSVLFTFILVSSLFLLWGFCNGMIDVMDKHFQDELGLTKSQSAWVQFAHYLGYFLMAMPAGWLASKLGYKGGIIAGLLMVSLGGFWFLPATHVNALAQAKTVSPTLAFIAFLAGVCAIAAGLTFLETIANPYTTVLGPQRYAATRINLAQSCNGVGWIFGPIVGSWYFYSTDAAGHSTGSQTLYIPYVAIAGFVLLLSAVFYMAYIPDVRGEDDYHIDDATPNVSHSIWSHPHFVMAVFAQFVYVAAQAGIFSFFINYMVAETPPIANSVQSGMASLAKNSPSLIGQWLDGWIETRTILTADDLQNGPALVQKLKQKADPISAFLHGKLSADTLKALDGYAGQGPLPLALRASLLQELNNVVNKSAIYDPQAEPKRLADVKLSSGTQQLMAGKLHGDEPKRLNRMLLADAYPDALPFVDGIWAFSDKGASNLASIGFICFLIGRFSGAGILKNIAAHKVLGFYALMNVAACTLIFTKLGWISVLCVFVSYFFMSIMFPTIFALGIFGLGSRAKTASSFIVMAIMGGAVLPKLMGYIADQYDMSRSFIVPLVCFGFVALYGFCWPMLSGAKSLHGVSARGGH